MHILAVLAAVATFILVTIGGVVHNTQSSLACLDWHFVPMCNGELFPAMIGGVLYEHGHRMWAAYVVGPLVIAMTVLAWRRRKADPVVGKLGVAALVLLCVQGTFGGITVRYQLPAAVSTAHLALAMAFLSLLVYLAVRTWPRSDSPRPTLSLGPTSHRALGLTLVVMFLQIVLGALVRHVEAGTACGMEFPTCAGTFWPEGFGWGPQIHMAHRIFAFIAGALAIGMAGVTFARGHGTVRALSVSVVLLVGIQIFLGIWSVWTYLHIIPVTAHLSVAALLLQNLWLLWLATRPVGAVTKAEVPLVRNLTPGQARA